MAVQILSVPVSEATAHGLAEWARMRRESLEQVAAEALEIVATLRDQPTTPTVWSDEDLAAIRRGIEQADRGELVPQAVVEQEIYDLLR